MGEAGRQEGGGDLRGRVVEALKQVYDPEIPVNIYDLGLIYGLAPWTPERMSEAARLQLGFM